MKTLLFVWLLFPVISFSQINPINEKDRAVKDELVGEAKSLGLLYATMRRFITNENDTSYAIFFNNAKYQHITDIKYFTFKETGGDFNKLFELIENTMLAKEKKEVDIPLEKGTLTLKFAGKAMQLYWYSNGVVSYSMYMTLPQFQKLFGKKNPHETKEE